MKKFILIGLLLLLCGIVEAKTATLYCRSDTHTINGLTAKILAITNSYSSSYMQPTVSQQGGLDNPYSVQGLYRAATISIVHADGSEYTIGTAEAQTSRTSGPEGVQSATFSCPQTSMLITDAIKIVWYCENTIRGVQQHSITDTWISGQLGWLKLNASTWTLYRYSYLSYSIIPVNPPFQYMHVVASRIYYGDSIHATYIDGIDYTGKDGGYAIIY